MRVVILGSGTAFPSLRRNSAGILIQSGDRNSLVDFGYGNVHQLLRLGLSYHDIDRIFFTHNHPDHMCDLIYFLFSTRYPLQPRLKDLPIVAAPGFREFFQGVMGAFKHWLIPETYQIDIIEQDEDTRRYDDLEVTTRRVDHIELSRGFRFTDPRGKTVAVSGDTDYCPGIVELGRGADLLILECSTPDALKVRGHLSPKTAARIAAETGCKTLCLTHFYPPMEGEDPTEIIRAEFSGEVVLAEDLTEFEL